MNDGTMHLGMGIIGALVLVVPVLDALTLENYIFPR